LSAYLDGELDRAQTERIERRLQEDPALAEAYRQLRAVEAALELWEPPGPPEDLAERIIRRAGRLGRPLVLRVAKWLVPLTAAAAIMFVAVVINRPRPQPVAPNAVEEFTTNNLDFFREYDVVANFDTLQAIDELESEGSGT